MNIRPATPKDVPALLAVYAPYVTDTAITFEYDVPTEADFLQRLLTFSEKFPYLVAEDDGQVVGYAYAHAFHTRIGYRYTVESTVYVERGHRRGGVGRALYAALESGLKALGYKNMNACITYVDVEDEYLTHDSVKFHERMGFSHAAHFHKCGCKFGRWYDVIWMEKFIGKHTAE